METKPTDFAFPHALGDVTQYQHIDCGLTKREFFAVIALLGLTAKEGCYTRNAHFAVELADTLIDRLNEKENEK